MKKSNWAKRGIELIGQNKLKAILTFSRSGTVRDQVGCDELCELARSANIQVLGKLSQKQKKINHKTYFGSGKIRELQNLILETQANLVVFNDDLTGIQARHLSDILQVSLLERKQLILKIFANRAQSYAGQLQVALAQKLDELSRVRGAWLGSLSRQGGGVGTRGPGEKALETDRRQIQRRIRILRKKLQTLKQNRSQQRKLRRRNQVCSFALIGYTNSGKSTLLNRLSRSQIPTENRLFMTLDPTTRKVFVPGLPHSVLTDTVGFIQDLPHHLVEAFKGTLEESSFADVLLHVIDLSNPNMNEQIKTVNSLIQEFGWHEKPIVHVYNKVDTVFTEQKLKIKPTPFCATVSAFSGQGVEHLLKEMKRAYLSLNKKIELFFPTNEEYKIHSLSQQATIHKVQQYHGGTLLRAKLPTNQISYWKSFMVNEGSS